MIRSGILAALALAAGSIAANAQEAPAAKPAADPDRAIRDGVDRYIKAFDAGDADALAAMFTPEARLIAPDGSVVEGRDAIRAAFAEVFQARPGRTLKVEIQQVRRLGPATAVESGTATFEGGADEEAQPARYVATHVRQDDGSWLLGEVRESSASAEDVSPADRLAPLAWLLGEWVDEGPDSLMTFRGAWEDESTRTYLIQTFEVRVLGEVILNGTQRLGWDAERGQVRGWIFDVEGGFAEQLWHVDGPDRWLIATTGIDARGDRATSTHVLERQDDGRIRLHVLARTFRGDVLPGEPARILTRRAPRPGSTSTPSNPSK